MPRAGKSPEELLERGMRLVFESGRPIAHVARDLGIPSETLRKYVRQVEANEGRRNDMATVEEREVSQAGCDGGFIPWFRPRERRAFWDVTIEEVPRGVVGARDAAGV